MVDYPQRKRIVILGAGFGGIWTLNNLQRHLHNPDDYDILIIDRRNYFLFTPLLHEVATGGVDPGDIVDPIRDVALGKTEHLGAEVFTVDLAKKSVLTDKGEVFYDYLVIALGATTNYFGIEGAQENTLTLKTIEDARKLKRHFIHLFDEANFTDDKERQKEFLRIVFIGGGATGVELAGEVQEFLSEIKKEFPRIPKELPEFYLLEGRERLLSVFDPSFSEKALQILQQKGFNVLLNCKGKKVLPNVLIYEEGGVEKELRARTVIWTSGVMASPIILTPEPERQKGRLLVKPTLQLRGWPEVFALGDMAAFSDERFGLLPTSAQVATDEGKFLGENLARLLEGKPLKNFHYLHKGDLVSIGKTKAFAQVGKGIKFSGSLAWLIWRYNYLFQMVGSSKKIRLFFDWLLYIFSKRDISEI